MNSDTHFLIVDDYPSIRELVKTQLGEFGFTNISIFEDAFDAWEFLNSDHKRVEFIISDWNMPKMTGFEFLENVRGHKEYSNVPFIILTTESEQDKILSAIEEGVSNYLTKPWEVEDFAEKVKMAWMKANGG